MATLREYTLAESHSNNAYSLQVQFQNFSTVGWCCWKV